MGPNSLIIQNDGVADTNAWRSPALWGPMQHTLNDAMMGHAHGRWFRPLGVNMPKFASTVSQMGLITLQDTGVTIQGDPTAPGVLEWGGMDADNDAGILTCDGNVGTSFLISSSDRRDLCFEVGLKKSSVSNNSIAFFAGLTEEGMAAATDTLLTTDSAALKDLDFIGFHVDQADGDAIDFVYNKASGGGITILIAGVAVPAAATYVKLGFRIDWTAPAAQRGKIFVNGVEQSTYLTHTQLIAATFPDGEELTPTLAFKKGEATIAGAHVRLWECAQKAV